MRAGPTADHKSVIRKKSGTEQPFSVFLIIWGIQWMLSSVIGFFGQWHAVERWQQLTVFLALLASLWALIAMIRSGLWQYWYEQSGKVVLPVLMIIGSLVILRYVEAIDPFFTPLLKSFVLAICYAQLGLWLGRPLVYLSLWLFALTAVVAVWYLGFASMLLGGFGGMSMIALAWIIHRSSKNNF